MAFALISLRSFGAAAVHLLEHCIARHLGDKRRTLKLAYRDGHGNPEFRSYYIFNNGGGLSVIDKTHAVLRKRNSDIQPAALEPRFAAAEKAARNTPDVLCLAEYFGYVVAVKQSGRI